MKLFLMKGKKFLFIFISILIFVEISSKEPFDLTEDKKGKEINIPISSFTAQYVLFDILGAHNEEHYVLSAYYDEQKTQRVQLGQSKNGNLKLFLSKDDFKEEVYTFLECNNYENCKGEYSYEFVDEIELSNGEPINYYLSQDETNLKFTINTNGYDNLNIWIRGQYNYLSYYKSELIFREEEGVIILEKDDNYGHYYLLEGNKGKVTLNINAYIKGDYINVGYIGYNNELYYNNSNINTTVNGPILTGLLKKNILDEVCFNVQKYKENIPIIANGLILTKFARIYLVNEDKTNTLDENHLEVDSFRLINDSPDKGSKFCVAFPFSQDNNFSDYEELIFTIQFLQFESSNIPYSFYEPQLNGIPYLRTIPGKSKSIISYQNNGDFEKITYNMIAIDGPVKMYIQECDNYPMCTYNNFDLGEAIQPINRFSTFNLKNNDGYNESPICQKQHLFVVACENNEEKFCEFKSLIYKNNDKIILSEDKFFNQYAPQNQENYFQINIPSKTNIQGIDIEITPYIGEIEVNTKILEKEVFRVLEKNEINKKLIQIVYNDTSKDELHFSVKSLTNTYYTILVTIIRDNSKTLEAGMTYLLTIDPLNQENIIKYSINHKESNSPFMVNFYSLNCQIEVKDIQNNEESSELKKYENFYYQIINSEDPKYNSPTYDYQINIKSGDISANNLCKIYASGIEGSEEHNDNSKDILVQDNTPQQVIFNNISKSYSFGYVHVDYKKDLLVKFNLKHSAKYKIILFNAHHKSTREETIVGDDLLYFKSSSWEEVCEKEEICYLHLDISLEMAKDNNSDSILEITAKSIDSNSVTYIPKNNMKKDYIQNKITQNYYTELGENEEGFVIVNFLRGSGKALAKIVSKLENENNPNWRGQFKLPTEDDTIEINPITKRLNFNSDMTNDKCKDGCFLLITIVSDIQDNSKDIRNYPFTLIVNSHLKDKTIFNSPSIISPLNSYIIGSIGTKNYSEFYSFWLNSDADRILIDLQSSVGGLIIYVGEDKENIDTENLKDEATIFEPIGSEYLFQIEKKSILNEFNKKHKEQRESIKDLVLNIVVWTNLIESIYETPFAFSVALQNKQMEIIKVNSDQKYLCNPVPYQGKYRCLYVIEYDFLNEKNDDLFIFANVKDKSATFNMFAKKITSDYYELALQEIDKYLPSEENNDYSLQNQKTNYLYIKDWDNKNEYILVSVEVTTQDTYTSVELITHIPLFQNDIIPNIANSQLLIVEKDKTISFNTSKIYMPIIGINCIGGSGEIYWDSQKKNRYYLKGRDDRLQITTKNKNEILIIKGTGNLEENYGMVFVLYYILKPFETDLAPLTLDGSVRYIYNEIDFPISYCSSINQLNEDYNKYYDFFFTFDKLDSKGNNPDSPYFEYDPFEIYGYLVEQSYIAEMKINPDTTIPDTIHSILGYYDQTMRTGILRVTQDFIEFANIESFKVPYLYLKIGVDKQINPRNYKEINVETTMLKSNSSIPISESTNQFGFLAENETSRKFVLRNDISKKYLILEFSSENDNLLASFPDNENVQGKEFLYGKNFYVIQTKVEEDLINFEISRDPKVSLNEKAYFMFRYIFEDDKNYKKYNLKDTKLKVTKNKLFENVFNYTIELTAMDNWRSYTLSYIARIIEEDMPTRSYLSLKPVSQQSIEYEDPIADSNDKLIFKIPKATIYSKEYVQVIIQIKSDEKVEYLSYDLQNQWEEDSTESDTTESDTTESDTTESDTTESDTTESDTTESDTTESDTTESDSTDTDSTDTDSTDTDSTDTDSTNTEKPQDDDDDDDDDTTLIVVVSCVGGVIIILIIILIIFVFNYSKKTKDLLEQVNNVSFKADKDNLLLSDDKNALE